MDAKKKLARKNLAAKSSAKSARRSADIVDPSKIVRELGDHINTRLRADVEDLDADLNEEATGAELIREAKLLSGDTARAVATDLQKFIRSIPAPQLSDAGKLIGHDRNAVTCVAMYKSLVVYGDKGGRVVVSDFLTSISSSSRWLLAPVVPGGVFSVAVSDTPPNLNHNIGLERSTVDTSVVSYIAAGGGDGSIHIWNTLSRTFVGALSMHRQTVTGLVFRLNSAILLSCSADSTIRVWSVPEMHAVDKFFGHLGKVNAIAALRKERAATGGDDTSTRYWKLEAATQMEFQRGNTSSEVVAMLNDQTIACGSVDGSLRLFDINKRSAIASSEVAHGRGMIGDGTGLEAEALKIAAASGGATASGEPNALSAMAATFFGDVLATGSCSGSVKLWRAEGYRSDGKSQPVLEQIGDLPCVGFVNGLAFSADNSFVAAAVAKEPRLGRWRTMKNALNSVVVFPLTSAARQQLRSCAKTASVSALPPLPRLGKSPTPLLSQQARKLQQPTIDESDDEPEDEGVSEDKELPPQSASGFTVGSDGRLIFNPLVAAAVPKLKATKSKKATKVPLATRRDFLAAKKKKKSPLSK